MREFITYTLDKEKDVSGPYQRGLIGWRLPQDSSRPAALGVLDGGKIRTELIPKSKSVSLCSDESWTSWWPRCGGPGPARRIVPDDSIETTP